MEQKPIVFNVRGKFPQINGDVGSDVSAYKKYCNLNCILGCSLYFSYLSHNPKNYNLKLNNMFSAGDAK